MKNQEPRELTQRGARQPREGATSVLASNIRTSGDREEGLTLPSNECHLRKSKGNCRGVCKSLPQKDKTGRIRLDHDHSKGGGTVKNLGHKLYGEKKKRGISVPKKWRTARGKVCVKKISSRKLKKGGPSKGRKFQRENASRGVEARLKEAVYKELSLLKEGERKKKGQMESLRGKTDSTPAVVQKPNKEAKRHQYNLEKLEKTQGACIGMPENDNRKTGPISGYQYKRADWRSNKISRRANEELKKKTPGNKEGKVRNQKNG